MKIVMAFGTFDVIHPGHLYYLKRAKGLGDKLIVVVARDSSIEKIKKAKPKYKEHERLEHVRAMPYPDKVILGNEGDDHMAVVEDFDPDVIALGYDQRIEESELKKELKKRSLKATVARIGSYKQHKYKSSKLK